MFIRRLDLTVFTITRHEHEFFNKRYERQKSDSSVSASMMKALVYYAWTRKSDQIIWTEEATSECLSLATKMSEIYGYTPDIPLVHPQDFRLNLARLSVA